MFRWLLDWAIVAISAAVVGAAFVAPRRIASAPPARADLESVVVLLAATGLLAWWVGRFWYATIRNYRRCIRELGAARTLRGVWMMVRLRLRQPRRDFFRMTPLIADMFPFAVCAAIYELVPVAWLALPMALLAASLELAMTFDRIRPPTWLFLSTSAYEAFWVFDDLRAIWSVTAVCLLDRGGAEGTKFYQAEREKWQRERRTPVGLFYDPTQPRIWSIRTRFDRWEQTVIELIDYVPLIVVDLREPSPFVREEVEWLAQPSRIVKALFLYDDQCGLLPEYAAVLPQSARVLTGPALYSYRSAWIGSSSAARAAG
jgi:hypothetical protein